MVEGFLFGNRELEKLGHEHEDHFGFRDNVIVVADGVTRDPLEVLPDVSTDGGLRIFSEKYMERYGEENPAFESARIIVEEGLKSKDGDVKNVLVSGNPALMKYNQKLYGNGLEKVDYVVNDLACCAASCAVVSGKELSWSYVADCGVAVVSQDAVWKTDVDMDLSEGARQKTLKTNGLGDWFQPETRKFTRGVLRNNKEYNGKGAYGVLSGEESGEAFVRSGSRGLKKGDVVLVYSDGALPFLFDEECVEMIREKDFEGVKKYCAERVKTEGTLVYYCNG